RQGAAAQGQGRAVRRGAPGRGLPGQVAGGREDPQALARPRRQDLNGRKERRRSMLDDTLKAQLAAYLGHLKRPIRITATLDEREASTQMRALLADIAGASDLVE